MTRRLKVALVGYGRMGKEVEQILLERGHEVVLRFDPAPEIHGARALTPSMLDGVDGVIEFSLAQGIIDNAAVYAKTHTAAVVGTTGWETERAAVRQLIEQAGSAYMYGSNYSVGANLFFRLAAQAARLIEQVDDYDIMVHEFHHKLKVDSPSGTALTTAACILDNLTRKTVLQTEKLDRPIRPEELHVSSTRGGSIPGIHSVIIDSTADTIEITHNARSRRGFAHGSVLALEWLIGKKGFLDVNVFMDELLGKGK